VLESRRDGISVATGKAGGSNNCNPLSKSRRDDILVAAGKAGGSSNCNPLSKSRRDGISVATVEAGGLIVIIGNLNPVRMAYT